MKNKKRVSEHPVTNKVNEMGQVADPTLRTKQLDTISNLTGISVC